MLPIYHAFVRGSGFGGKLEWKMALKRLLLLSLCILTHSLDIKNEETYSSPSLSILFLHSMFPSHYYPLVSLGAELVSRGHRVTSFGVTIETFEHIPGLIKSYGIDYIEGIKLERKIYDAYINHTQETNISGSAFSVASDIRKGIFQERDYLTQMAKAIDAKLNGSHYDYIIGEQATIALLYYVYRTWKTNNIMLVMFTIGIIPNYIIPWPYPCPLTPLTDNMSFLERFINTVVYRPLEYIAVRIFIRGLIPDDEEGFSDPSLHLIYQPVLLTTVIGVERPLAILPTQHYIGPMLLPNRPPLDPELVSWLEKDTGLPVVYVSTGTLTVLSSDTANIIQSLSDHYKLVWSRANTNRGKSSMTERIYMSPWVEQTSLLKHPAIKLAILHCGVNSIHEALYYAVPILCIPQGGDQFNVGFRLTSQKLGISLTAKELTIEKLKESAKSLIEDNIYKKNVKRASRLLREGGGARRGAELVELYAAMGYSHALPAFIRDEWSSIKYYNLDVWAVIIGTAVLILWGCGKCCRCCRCCFKKH